MTVDAPVPGKREADERIAAENLVSAVSGAVATNDKKGGGLGRVMAKYIDPTLVWEDLAWLKQVSGLPLVLKGIQTAADARKAVEYGADGILLSNHGGRSLDTYASLESIGNLSLKLSTALNQQCSLCLNFTSIARKSLTLLRSL